MQQPQSAPSSGASSRVPIGCITLFAAPFIIMGLWLAYVGLKAHMPGQVAFGAVFAGVGALVIGVATWGQKALAADAARKGANPDKPWLWREDWAQGYAKDNTRGVAIFFWIFALLWNGISWPVAFLIRPEIAKGNYIVLIALIFPLVGLGLLAAAIYQTLQRMKFGTSVCHLPTIPIPPGRTFRGELELHNDAVPESGYKFRLASIRSVTSGSGKNRSTHESVLWDDERVVSASAAMRSPVGTRVPFEFVVPPTAHGTEDVSQNEKYFWRLTASADLPGVDYSSTFQLPIFGTGEPVDDHEFVKYQEQHRAEASRQELPPNSGIVATPLPTGGTEYRLHAQKTCGGVFWSIAFLIGWNAAIAAMIYFHAPWGFPAFFIAIDILIIMGTIDYFFGRSKIDADRQGLRVRRTWLGIGSTKTYDASQIESIEAQSPASESSNAVFGVNMKLTDGKTHGLASYLRSREIADIAAAKIWNDLGKPSPSSVSEQPGVED